MSDNRSDFSRRKFLATAGLATAGLASLPQGLVQAQDEKTPAGDEAPKKLLTRTLGRTGIEVPVVSMGAGACADPGVVQAAFEAGVRHFDTAANYQTGANEQMVGGVLKKMGVRDQAIIGTKIYTPGQRREMTVPEAKKRLEKLLDGSLKRLKTDYVDILYIHVVDTKEHVTDPVITEAMAYLKELDKVRFIGLSTHTNMADVLTEAARTKFWDVILTSINFTMADDTAMLAAIAAAAEAGIGIVGMKTMAGGGRWPNPESRRDYSSSVVATALTKWTLHNENVHTIIPGFANYEFMEEDISVAYDLEYTEQEAKLLSDNAIKLGLGFCQQCRKCLASCPNGVDVPTLMRTHMYATQYSNFHMARAALAEIPNAKSIASCSSCSSCAAQCANTVDIARRIDELKLIYS
jgi:predicted aldo/keto reductase-like oxidoreductase